MSQPCQTCGPAGKQQEDEGLSKILIKAKADAKKEQKPMAVWKGEDGWTYGDAFTAYANRCPIATVVSQYDGVAAY